MSVNAVLAVVVVAAGFYFRSKYEMKYNLPAIKENEDLSAIYKWILVPFAVIFLCFIMGLTKIAFIILLITIPFVLYLNIKTNWIGYNKMKNDKDRD